MNRSWISMWEYRKTFGESPYDIADKPDYREDEKTCRWCGKKLSGRRTSFCSNECSQIYNDYTVWERGTSTLPYRIQCRDNFTCTECGEIRIYKNEHGIKIPIGIDLEVHHINLVSNGGNDHASNLRTVCKECHKRIHREAMK